MNTDTKNRVELLRRNGIAYIDPLSAGEVADITSWFSNKIVFNGHVKAKADKAAPGPQDAAAMRWPAFSPDMRDVVTAPYLLESALSTFDIAKEYFGEQPRLYSMNAFWTHPSDQQYQDTHSWHRDGDDRKQLVVFTYGTDVMSPEQGGHYYQVGTHKVGDDALGRDFRQPPEEGVKLVLGPAGTRFMADTNGLHAGQRPNQLRLLLWARWGVSNPPASYHWDKLAPVPRSFIAGRYPADPEMQEAIRLVVN